MNRQPYVQLQQTRSQGFTLIELLVVIAIIGILSSVVLVSLNQARGKARDAARISAVQQMEKAIELYYFDHGHYPPHSYTMTPHQDGSTFLECGYQDRWCDLEDILAPYISQLPRDDLGAKTNRRYLYKSNSPHDMYGLSVILENAGGAGASDGGYDDNRYERGQLPGYCMSKYSGTGATWRHWDGLNCSGGN